MEQVDIVRVNDPLQLSEIAEKALVSHNSFYNRICSILSTGLLEASLAEFTELMRRSEQCFDELVGCLSASPFWHKDEIKTLCIKRKAMRDSAELLIEEFPVQNEERVIFYLEMFWATQSAFFTDLIGLQGKLFLVRKQLGTWAI